MDADGKSASTEVDVDSLRDIRHNPAIALLEQLRARGTLSSQRYEFFMEKYTALHDTVLNTYEQERKWLGNARELNQQSQRIKKELEDGFQSAKADDEEIQKCRLDLAKADADLNQSRQAFETLISQTSEYSRQRQELQQEVDLALKKRDEEFLPQVQKLQDETSKLKIDNKLQLDKYAKCKAEREQMIKRMDYLVDETERLSKERNELQAQFARMEDDPGKIKKQAEVVDRALQSVKLEAEHLSKRVTEADLELSEQLTRKKHMEDERYEKLLSIENHKSALSQQELRTGDVESNIMKEREENSMQLSRRAELEFADRQARLESNRMRDVLSRLNKEKEKLLRKFRRLESTCDYIRAQIEKAKVAKILLEKETDDMRMYRRSLENQMEELKRDVDIQINNFLKQETSEKRVVEMVRDAQKEVVQLEQDMEEVSLQLKDLYKDRTGAISGRESQARESTKQKRAQKWASDLLKMKDVEVLEMEKRNTELTLNLKQLLEMYTMIKAEKNKYASLIQSATMACAELKEKNGILENEFDVLRRETLSKDKCLTKERSVYGQAFVVREALRQEVNNLTMIYATKKEKIQEQLSLTERLNSIINSTEKDMLAIKKAYEGTVEDRNFSGIQLIDRNDELCILYEKLNVEENILRQGEIELQQREEEIRMLNIQLRDLDRAMEVATRNQRSLNGMEEELESLQSEMEDEVDKVEILSKVLELPSSAQRIWRNLEGKAEKPEELQEKLEDLEEKLNVRKEQLLEKDLILDEVTQVADKLRSQGEGSKGTTVLVAQRVNNYQGRIRTMTRKIMSIVAELSVYQAQSIKLEAERNEMAQQLNEAKSRIEQGYAPTDEIDYEFERLQRDEILRAESYRTRQQYIDMIKNLPPTLTRTTAVPRPNAYIPDDELGLPKPYGNHGPFRPVDPGTSMRHIRKPEPRPLEI